MPDKAPAKRKRNRNRWPQQAEAQRTEAMAAAMHGVTLSRHLHSALKSGDALTVAAINAEMKTKFAYIQQQLGEAKNAEGELDDHRQGRSRTSGENL